jgi:LmbE family N-acetylglucosaminyl deacetylase
VLVIAPHPDDETLGCGGTLLKHRESGDIIHWLIVTSLAEEDGSVTEIARRKKEIEKIRKAYNFASVIPLNFPAMRLDKLSLKEIVTSIGKAINATSPNILYIPNPYDIHSDHRIVYDATVSCSKWFRYPSIKRILIYEVISETEFNQTPLSGAFMPNSFSDISNYINKKIEIMKIYKSELARHPFPRSSKNVRALATFRGATAGFRYSEAFVLYKEAW